MPSRKKDNEANEDWLCINIRALACFEQQVLFRREAEKRVGEVGEWLKPTVC